LMPWARALLDDAGCGMSDLDGVAVGRGPGAFTGLRVGLATALGVAQALGVPLIAVDSLEIRARRLAGDRVLAMLDARKARVYASWFPVAGQPALGPAQDVAPEIAVAWPEGPFVAVGEGAVVYREQVVAAGGVVCDAPEHPGVDALARLAAQRLAAGDVTDAADVLPRYVRAPDAKKPGGR